MIHRTALLVGILASGLATLSAEEPTTGVFTSEQAEAGRADYDRTCGRCHTPSLLGRNGDPSELPPLDSLSADDQKFIRNRGFVFVPPLAGKEFLDRWGDSTAAELIARFQITVDDGFFGFTNITDETTVNITAYVLQVNGAKAGSQELTRTTGDIVNLITR
jgi:hypothetical protein